MRVSRATLGERTAPSGETTAPRVVSQCAPSGITSEGSPAGLPNEVNACIDRSVASAEAGKGTKSPRRWPKCGSAPVARNASFVVCLVTRFSAYCTGTPPVRRWSWFVPGERPFRGSLRSGSVGGFLPSVPCPDRVSGPPPVGVVPGSVLFVFSHVRFPFWYQKSGHPVPG